MVFYPLPLAKIEQMPGNGILTDYWRDILNATSLIISGVSLLTSIIGLIYSILSWREAKKAKTAAEAAKEAAEQARNESRRRFEAYVAGKLRDYIPQVIEYLHRLEWGKASLILRLLGEEAGHFAVQDATWQQSANDLRLMSTDCIGWESNKRKKRHPKKWNLLLNDVLAKLPAHHSPI